MSRTRWAAIAAGLVFIVSTGALSGAAVAATAVFAGGCFWCVEADFDKVEGVTATVSGFSGGTTVNPTYEEVVRGGTGHYEAVQVTYDPADVSFEELLEVFWYSVDPTDAGGQFCDRGQSYATAIFVDGPEERAAAEASKQAVARDLQVGGSIVTPILDDQPFYVAEDYHQNYYASGDVILTRFGLQPKSEAYARYRQGCGRDARLEEVWGDKALMGIGGL